MAHWVVLTSERNCGLHLVVDAILECRDLPDGRFRWVVDAPEYCRQMLLIVSSVLSVELERPSSTAAA